MNRRQARIRRGLRTKAQIANSDRPRLVVFKSAKHIYAQIVVKTLHGDVTVASSSTHDKELRTHLSGDKKARAHLVGKSLGQRAKEKNFLTVAFDRAGFAYHGRVKALAEGAREAGLLF